MQHKALLAAVFCGALCLTGCIKNIESESVTEVRKAKAQEIASVAKLNEAQASAATTLANAQAAISAAQAELIKAQAAKETAEAALIQAKADLEKVNVEIAKVKLEEEKVVLQQKKIELEKLIAECEAAIAKAEAEKQEYLNRLNKAKAQAEIDEINAKKALLEAEKNLMAAADEMEAEKQVHLVALWSSYEQAVEEVYDAQAKLIKKQVQAAQVKAGIQSGLEAMAEEAADISQEIEMLQAQADYLTQIAGESFQEIMAEILKYREEYMTADAARMEAYNKMNAAREAWLDVYEYENSASYIQPEFTNEWGNNPLQDIVHQLADQMGIDVESRLEEGTGAEIWGIAPEGEFLPFWKDETFVVENSYVYPAPKDGIMPKYWTWFTDGGYVPASIYYENYEKLLNFATEFAENAKESAKVKLEEDKAEVEEQIAKKKDLIDAAKAYVAEADKQLVPLEEAVDNAKDAITQATEAVNEAQRVLDNYALSNTTYAKYAQELGHLFVVTNYAAEVNEKLSGAESLLTLAETAVPIVKEAKYEADKNVAMKQADVKAKKAAVTDAIVKAYEDAQAAVTKQEGVVEGKEKAYQDAIDAERAAELIYLADPDDTTKKAAWETAKTATANALAALNTERDNLTTMLGTLNTAKAAYDAVNDPYEAAVEELKSLEEIAAGYAESFVNAKAEVEQCKAEVEQLKKTKALADEAVKKVEAEVDKAKEAYDAYVDGTDPEEKVLIDNLAEANKQYQYAVEVHEFVLNEYYNVLNSYNNYIWYTDYLLNEEFEYSEVNALADLEKQLADLDANYEHFLELIAEGMTELEKLSDEIEHFKAIEPAYHNVVNDCNAARAAYIEASKEFADALNVVYEVEAKEDALEVLASKFIYTDGDEWYDTMETVDLINEINTKIAVLEEELAEIQANMEMNYVSDEYNMAVYANIMAKIEKLQSKIEVYSALADFYWAQIQEAIGSSTAEPVVE